MKRLLSTMLILVLLLSVTACGKTEDNSGNVSGDVETDVATNNTETINGFDSITFNDTTLTFPFKVQDLLNALSGVNVLEKNLSAMIEPDVTEFCDIFEYSNTSFGVMNFSDSIAAVKDSDVVMVITSIGPSQRKFNVIYPGGIEYDKEFNKEKAYEILGEPTYTSSDDSYEYFSFESIKENVGTYTLSVALTKKGIVTDVTLILTPDPTIQVEETTEIEEITSVEAVTEEEIDEESKRIQIAHTIFTAFQNLDVEALKPYMKAENYEEWSEIFNLIKENPEDLEFWKNTIGSAIYLTDSDILLAKSVDYVESRWYTDCWNSNSEIPAHDAADFPVEYLDEIYNTYYNDAPYIFRYRFSEIVTHETDDGNYRWVLSDTVTSLGCSELRYLDIDYSPSELRAIILLNNQENFVLGYDYLGEKIPGYEAILSKDLDRMLEIYNAADIEKDPHGISIIPFFDQYYKNEENKEILQQFYNEEFEAYRTLSSVCFFYPAAYDTLDLRPLFMSESDIAYLEQLGPKVVEVDYMRQFPDNFSNNYLVYSHLVTCAKNKGIIE